ncbi:MAG: heme o synthase [Zetaproteobacteria bacterium]|nr:heme o synthase [Zetaproteobacteria bacterium]
MTANASPAHAVTASHNSELDCKSPSKSTTWRDYFSLTKPTITMLVAVTVVPGVIMASPNTVNTTIWLCAILGASLMSASAAVLNQVLETSTDQIMDRTQHRAVAHGRTSKYGALRFAAYLAAAGMLCLILGTTLMAAFIALCGHLFYVCVYTMYLKPMTPQNIVIGGASGAVGPLIGWAAIDPWLGWPAWAMFLIIFLWTPPHFWALALVYKREYARAGIPMYPIAYGDVATKKAMFKYSLCLFPFVVSLYLYSDVGLIYLIPSLLASTKFSWDAWKLALTQDSEKYMNYFHYSCIHVLILFGALTTNLVLFPGY